MQKLRGLFLAVFSLVIPAKLKAYGLICSKEKEELLSRIHLSVSFSQIVSSSVRSFDNLFGTCSV